MNLWFKHSPKWLLISVAHEIFLSQLLKIFHKIQKWLSHWTKWMAPPHYFRSGSVGRRDEAQRFIRSWYVWPCRKQISTTVMLSQPSPAIWQSGAKQCIINCSQISSGSVPLAMCDLTNSTTSCAHNAQLQKIHTADNSVCVNR